MSEAKTIVTGETREAFMNHRMNLSEPAEKEVLDLQVKSEEINDELEKEIESDLNPVHEEKKPNSKIEKRFSDLTKQREEARSEVLRERLEKEALQTKLDSYENNKKEVLIDKSKEPQPLDYQDAFEYAKDLAKWSANEALVNRDKEEQNKVLDKVRDKTIEDWNQRMNDVRLEVPNYDEIITNSEYGVSDSVRDAIIESEVGPKILLHLAQNPEFTKELGLMSASSALKQIGRLEAKYEIVTNKEIVKPVVKLSRSAEPISPIRGGRSLDVELNSDGEYTGSFSSYKQARKQGKLK